MGKQLLLFTAACMLVSAILAGCSVGRAHVQNNSAATKTTYPKTSDTGYSVYHPTTVIGTDWTALKQSPLILLPDPKPGIAATMNPEKITQCEYSSLKKDNHPLNKKSTAATRKSMLAKGKKPIHSGSKDKTVATGTAPVATEKQDTVKTNEPVAIETPKTDTSETLAGNSKTDTVEPVAVPISNSGLVPATGPNPGLLDVSGNDETVDIKPLSGTEMDALIGKYSVMISVEPKEITNYSLFRFIDEWYGTEYKWGGMDNTGIDCSALSQKLYEEVYNVDIERTAREQYKSCERIKNSAEASQGDLVFFRIHHIRISHVGVYLANGYFVHASSSQGVVISNLKSKYWRRRFAGCGRIVNEDPDTESENLP